MKLNVYTNAKMSNKKKLQLKALVDPGYTHIRIKKHLVKEKRIKIEPMDRSFEVFNTDRTRMEK